MEYFILNDYSDINKVYKLGKLTTSPYSGIFSEKNITPDTDIVIYSMHSYEHNNEHNNKYLVFNLNDYDEIYKLFHTDYYFKLISPVFTEEYYNKVKAIIKNNDEIDDDRRSWSEQDDQYEDTWWWTYEDLEKYRDFSKNYKIQFCLDR